MPPRLTEDLIVEILSRLPVKSLHRFICVCRRWQHLISYSDDRRRLPQTLAGFFYTVTNCSPKPYLRFADMFGSRRPLFKPPFAFLPSQGDIEFLDCCNGLLLCRWRDVSPLDHYIVCNPATGKWVALLDSNQPGEVYVVRLGFDPAVSPHFHVFELLAQDMYATITGLEVYSSETGRWVHKEKGWNEDILLRNRFSPTVFLNGRLHFQIYDGLNHSSLATVDTKGETCTNFPVPGTHRGFIQLSQGRLHYACFETDGDGLHQLKVYFLQDYDSQEWILKHSIESSHLFGEADNGFPLFDFVAMHLESNWFFFIVEDATFICYNMDRREVKVICHLADLEVTPYFPYVPLYSDLPALQM